MSREEQAKWDARYRAMEGQHTGDAPSAALAAIEGLLPRGAEGVAPRGLDVGGGAGRHALWLARRGLDVTIVDVSEVGLAIARGRAEAAGARVATVAADLEREPLPAGPWDLVVVCHFLLRPMLGVVSGVLAPGGVLAVVHPTRSNLERHARPGPAFLLEDGELPSLVKGLDVVRYDEGWLEDGRHEARLVAVKR